jgi:hypothetical protein
MPAGKYSIHVPEKKMKQKELNRIQDIIPIFCYSSTLTAFIQSFVISLARYRY